MSTKPLIRKPQLKHFGGSEEKALAFVQAHIIEHPFTSANHFKKHWGISPPLMQKWIDAGLVKFKSKEELYQHRIEELLKTHTMLFPLSPKFKPRERK